MDGGGGVAFVSVGLAEIVIILALVLVLAGGAWKLRKIFGAH